MERIALLGATGSIGTSTVDVVSRYPERFSIEAVAAGSNYEKLAEVAARCHSRYAVIADKNLHASLKEALRRHGSSAEAFAGPEAIDDIAAMEAVDTVVGAIVGAAGISSTFSAAPGRKKTAVGQQERRCLRWLFIDGYHCGMRSKLYPVDSEHNAIFQCLEGASPENRSKARIILTASGGPFRNRKDLSGVTVEEATHHPNWSMGKKITVDSATLMNKGLEVIEARWLFDFPADRIDVVVHPQSIIHSMVQYEDGVVIAQLGAADMRIRLLTL